MSYYKVIYDKLFPYAPYLNERIGVEILVEAGQSPMEALEDAKKIVEEFYQSKNPQPISGISHVADNIPVPEVQVRVMEAPQSLIEQIESCTELKVLESYRLIAKTKPEYLEAYESQYKKISTPNKPDKL